MLRLGLLGVVIAVTTGCPSADATNTTQGESSGSAGGGGEVIVDGGGIVEMHPDGAAACPAGVCNYQTGEGCSGSTPSCVPMVNPSNEVVAGCEAAGTGKLGDACTAFTDCAAGYVCIGKTCHKLCCGGDWTGCPSADQHCYRSLVYDLGSAGLVDTNAMICDVVNTCDALVPSSCNEAGETCQIVDPTGATGCAPEGTGSQGDACPCKGGFLCVANACRRLCNGVIGGGEPHCQPGEGVCTHFTRDPPGVGECTP